MRQELKNFNWHIYGLDIFEFAFTIETIDKIIDDRQKRLEHKFENMKILDEDGNEVVDDSNSYIEATSDLGYYTWLDNFYIYQFGLWRLQGVFEGILRQEFFPSTELGGLRKKLDKVKALGYIIVDTDYNELIEWSKLRNALSHFPTEKYRPVSLDREDIIEYKELVERITNNLLKQKAK